MKYSILTLLDTATSRGGDDRRLRPACVRLRERVVFHDDNCLAFFRRGCTRRVSVSHDVAIDEEDDQSNRTQSTADASTGSWHQHGGPFTTSNRRRKHGLLRLINGDWNDSIVYTHLTPEQASQTLQVGESVLNSAMAAYVFDYYAHLLDFIEHRELAVQAHAKAKEQREAVQAQWYGRWYRRARPSEELGWVGERQMWLEPQPWVLIGGCVPPEKIATLVVAVDELARRPSPIGALLQSHPDLTMKDEPGTGTNGGIFAAINGILVGLSH
jgi:Glycosyl hydrolase 36 superfamily, catalytic domain